VRTAEQAFTGLPTNAIVYLSSDEASFIQGAVLDVGGGRNAA
jgi:hypothetical protein